MPLPLHRQASIAEHGFTLVELLVSMAITTVIVGATMGAMNDAIKATDGAMLLTSMNNGLRTSLDLMVRDMLQVGQGLPSTHVISIPQGNNSQVLRMPGPPGSNLGLALGATEITAVIPRPDLGPIINGRTTDMITALAADSAFDQIRLTAIAANGSSLTVYANEANGGANITDGGPNDLDPGDLLMLSKGSTSTLVQVSRVVGQTVFLDANDSLNLNQPNAADGNIVDQRNTAPVDGAIVAPAVSIPTQATRIRMISYYLDATTDPLHPRLIRRMNNGNAVTYDNTLGTAVAFDVEDLQITYDLANGVTNPTNVRMVAADLNGTGRCAPSACSPNQIRKVNIMLSARSRRTMKGTQQFLRNRLVTQVSLRSLAFVDRYR